MATTADISQLLQLFYEKDTIQTFSDEFWAHDELQSAKNLRWDGDKVKIHIHTGRNTGVAAAAEGMNLPTAGYQTTSQGEITRKYVYGRIALTGPAIYSAQSTAHAFKDVLDFEMERLVRDIISSRSFHLYTGYTATSTAGKNGVRAKITSVAGDGLALATRFVLTLQDAGGLVSDIDVAGVAPDVPDIGATRYLRIGDPIVTGTLAELAVNAGATLTYHRIAEIDRVAQTVTLDLQSVFAPATGTPAAADYIARGFDATGTNEANLCPNGLGTLLNFKSGSFQGLALTSESWECNAKVNVATDAAGAPVAFVQNTLTMGNLHSVIQQVREVSGQQIDLMVAHPSMINEYMDLIDQQVRYEPRKMTGGYDTLTFASGSPVKWIFDNDCPYGTVFFLNKKSLMWAINRPWGWEKTDGAVLRSVTNQDSFTARYVSYYDLGFKQLNSHGVLSGVKVENTLF